MSITGSHSLTDSDLALIRRVFMVYTETNVREQARDRARLDRVYDKLVRLRYERLLSTEPREDWGSIDPPS